MGYQLNFHLLSYSFVASSLRVGLTSPSGKKVNAFKKKPD